MQLRTVSCEGSLHSDPALLASILDNLLGNAIRYTDKGSALFKWQPEATQLRIDVIDTGIGIAKHDLNRIFDDFYQIDKGLRGDRKGFGLGLAVVTQFAALLDHPIEVTSSRGKGSRFSISVPFTPAAGTVMDGWDSQHVLGRLSVLVVDDDAAVLHALGARVIAAKRDDETLA